MLVATLAMPTSLRAEVFEMMMLEVSCNGGPPDQALVLRSATGEFLIEESLADIWRVTDRRPATVLHRGVRFLPLVGFVDSEVRFDAARLSLQVTLPPRYLKPQVKALRTVEDPAADAGLGLYLDYDISYQDLHDSGRSFASVLSPNFFSAWGVLQNSLIYRNGHFDYSDEEDDLIQEYGSRLDDGLIRLETTWLVDSPDRMESYRFGDGSLPSGVLHSAARFGGIQLASNFATRPSFVTFPLPELSGAALLRSSADLYVNERLSYRQELAPGPFSFEEIPVTTGAGQMRLVTRDLAGREQTIVADFYAAPQILRRGLADYAYTVVFLREDYGIESNDYDDPFFSALHRKGVTDAVTVEGLTELSSDVSRAGGSLAWLAERFGVSALGFGVSRSKDEGWGTEWLIAHEYQSRTFRIAGSARGTSDEFRQLTSVGNEFLPRYQYSFGGGINMGRHGSLASSYIRQQYRQEEDISLLSLTYSNTLRREIFVSAFATLADAGDSDFTVGLSFTRNLGDRRSATTSLSHGDGGARGRAEIRSNLPVGPGFGYRFVAGVEDDESEWQGELNAASRAGRYTIAADHDGQGTSWQFSTTGSAAWVGGRPFVAREIRDSFAVVKVNGFEGVRVYLENQEIGETDATGRILLPGLRPYEKNRVRIEIQDLPLTARIDAVEIGVAPYFGAGVAVDFPVREGNDVMLRLLTPDGASAPQGGVILIAGRERPFPVGIDGAAYLQDVTDGEAAALVWQDRRCEFTIELPALGGVVPDLGEVTCTYAE
jgi:outer membrane usher protein